MFYLQLRDELWKLFGKKRTYIGFLMFLLAQNFIVFICRFTHVMRRMVDILENNGFDAKQYLSVLTITTVMVVLMSATMLPLYAALIGGDLVAKEVEDGTLRMILSRPVSRLRLLILKWVTGLIFSFLLVMALGLLGLVFTSLWFPWGGLAVVPPMPFTIFDSTRGLEHYLLSQLLLVPKACTIMTLAFMFSCFNMKPAAATILALSVLFISIILQEFPFFADYRSYLISYDMDVWREVISAKIAWWKIGESFSFLVGYNVTFLAVGVTAFQLRDIKS